MNNAGFNFYVTKKQSLHEELWWQMNTTPTVKSIILNHPLLLQRGQFVVFIHPDFEFEKVQFGQSLWYNLICGCISKIWCIDCTLFANTISQWQQYQWIENEFISIARVKHADSLEWVYPGRAIGWPSLVWVMLRITSHSLVVDLLLDMLKVLSFDMQ